MTDIAKIPAELIQKASLIKLGKNRAHFETESGWRASMTTDEWFERQRPLDLHINFGTDAWIVPGE